MSALLQLSRLIDRLSEWVGRWLSWLVLIMVLISATNASVRKALSFSSNSFLEIQWYLFAAVFLLASGYTLLRQEHVKIDVVLGRFSRPTQIKVEIFGLVAFLMPFVFAVIAEVMPLVIKAYYSGEMSENAGGLVRWPVYALVPIGFALLGIQGLSEIIKRVAFLKGLIDDPGKKQQAKTAEEELAEVIRARAEAEAAAAMATGGKAK
ncbi:TRAP transporter small permease subunit [Ideonella sp. BN130291]|uniref:TRAP transporter small permease subunit n=1 Tax=Ideonella sp. BN130291 TaxID=3112940 RepID=UPI002E272EBF|nr:TRAP transporter small permease subunit [Ideonella sp. BN130291]